MLKLSITLPNSAQINLESEDSVVVDKILGIVLADVTRSLLALPGAQEPGPESTDRPDTRLSYDSLPVESVPPVEDVVPVAASPTPQPVEQAAPATVSQPEAPVVAPSIPTEEETVGAVPPVVETSLPPQPQPTLQDVPPVAWREETLTEGERPLQWPVPGPVSGVNAGAGVEVGAAAERSEGPSEVRSNGIPAMGGSQIGVASLVPAVSEQAFVDFCRAANPLGDMRRVVVAAEGASRYLAIEGVDAEGLGRLFDIVGWPRAHNFVQTLRNAARSKFGWLERIPGRAGHYTVTDLGRATALGR